MAVVQGLEVERVQDLVVELALVAAGGLEVEVEAELVAAAVLEVVVE